MMNEAWEDSLSYFDMRDLLYAEAMDRLLASAHHPSRCRLGRCKRHGLCLGPMVQRPGESLPRRWKQYEGGGFRPACMQLFHPPLPRFTLPELLEHGPAYMKMAKGIPALGFADFLGNRIARSRAKRNGPEPWPFTPLQTAPATRQSCRAKRRCRRRR